MKRLFSVIIAALMLLPQTVEAKKTGDKPEGLKVMSYNIRLGSANDGTNSWALRYPATAEMIKDQAPDVFGVQAAL
jgi:endonuclease/exonuclease/phosphatase family metal-dependent hydrolase